MLVEEQCNRGDPNDLGALYCEETCDDILGRFCPNENEFQDCNTNGCPGNNPILNQSRLISIEANDFHSTQLTVPGGLGAHGKPAPQPVVGALKKETEQSLSRL